jgi:hypothetical protein
MTSSPRLSMPPGRPATRCSVLREICLDASRRCPNPNLPLEGRLKNFLLPGKLFTASTECFQAEFDGIGIA